MAANKIDIPDGWKVKKLGEVVEINNTRVLSEKLEPLSISAGIGFVNQTEKFGRDLSGKQYEKYIKIQKYDFAYNKGNSKKYPQGCIYLLKDREYAAIPNVFECFRIKKHNCFYYEQLFISGFLNKQLFRLINAGVRNDGLLNINSENFYSCYIPIPPIAEQEKIAEILSLWDKAIEQTKELIAYKEKQKKGLMQNLLTGKKRLPGYTDKWKTITLGEVAETYGGLTNKTKKDFENKGSKYISYLEIYQNYYLKKITNNYVLVKDNETQTELKYGDILFTLSSETPEEVGISCVILFEPKEKIYLNSFSFCLRLKENNILYPLFSAYIFRAKHIRKLVNKLAQGATRYNLSKINFLKLNIAIPTSLDEQKAITDILCKADEEIELLKKQLDLYTEQKKGLMQNLLTGKVRVTV